MSKAGDERGQRDHELQERAALHGEREYLVNRAHTHAGFVEKRSTGF